MFALNRHLENQESKNSIIPRTPIYGNLNTFAQLNLKIIEGSSITNTQILDFQGINWQEITHISRAQFCRKRMTLYKPNKQYELVQNPSFPPKKRIADQEYFLVDKYIQGLKPQNPHSQLPDTVKAVSRNDIYYLSEEHVKHCSLLKKTVNKFDHNIDDLGNINFRPACLAVNERCFVLGGFYGGLLYQDIMTGHSVHLPNVTDNLINSMGDTINQVDILQNGGDNSSSLQLLTAQNDKYVQIFDLEQFRNIPKMRIQCSASANVAKFSPVNQNILAVFCDKTDAEIMDSREGSIIQTLKGHYDYGLTLAWHPSGNTLATGNQDGTTRIWDIRNTTTSVHVLPCQMGNSYNVKYNQSGEYLAVLECSDFLNIYCSGNDYQDHQVQEFIGQSTGLAFYEDRIFVGVNINQYHGILQMSQRNSVSRKYENQMAEYSI